MKDLNQGIFEVWLDDVTLLAVENVGSSVRYHMKQASVVTSLSINAKVREAKGIQIPDEDFRGTADRLEWQLVKSGSELVQSFQKRGMLGLGDFVRIRTRYWKEED